MNKDRITIVPGNRIKDKYIDMSPVQASPWTRQTNVVATHRPPRTAPFGGRNDLPLQAHPLPPSLLSVHHEPCSCGLCGRWTPPGRHCKPGPAWAAVDQL
jgi:hypothetical protein